MTFSYKEILYECTSKSMWNVMTLRVWLYFDVNQWTTDAGIGACPGALPSPSQHLDWSPEILPVPSYSGSCYCEYWETDDASSAWVFATHVRDLDEVLGSWL